MHRIINCTCKYNDYLLQFYKIIYKFEDERKKEKKLTSTESKLHTSHFMYIILSNLVSTI